MQNRGTHLGWAVKKGTRGTLIDITKPGSLQITNHKNITKAEVFVRTNQKLASIDTKERALLSHSPAC